jgi:multiple sugar transport system substrate-binding protein
MQSRRQHLAAIAGLFAAGTLATPAAHAADITLRFLFTQPPDTWDAVIAAFEKANPGVHIERQQVPFDTLNAQVQSRIGAQDTSIDIYGTDEPRVPAFARRGYLTDLSEMRSAFEQAVSHEAIDAVSANGKIWSFPLWTSTQVLFYNNDLLAKAGLPAPSIDPNQRMTWEAVLDSARKAQAAGAKWGVSFDQVDRYYELQPLYVSSGAGIGLGGPDLLTPSVATPKWIETTDWYGKLFSSGLAPRGIPPEQMPPLFASGQLAYMVAGPWNMGLFFRTPDLKFGVAAMPYFASGRPSTPTDSWSIGVNPYSEHKDVAIKFARFMTLDDGGALMSTEKLPLPPANKAAFDAYLKRMEQQAGATLVGYDALVRYELANTAVHRPRSIGYVNFEQIMNKAFSDVRNGADAAATLKSADEALRSAFARLR